MRVVSGICVTACLIESDPGQIGKLFILEVHAIESPKTSASDTSDMSVVPSLLRSIVAVVVSLLWNTEMNSLAANLETEHYVDALENRIPKFASNACRDK